MNLKYKFEYLVVRVIVALVSRLPRRAAMALGAALGAFAWKVPGIRRQQVADSMRMAFPESDGEELDRLGLLCYRNTGRSFVEMFSIHRMSDERMNRLVSFRNRGVLDRALDRGRGVVNITFHYGNWELMGAFAARSGLPIDVIARGQQNPLFDSYVKDLRRANGMELIPVSLAPRRVPRSLRAGRIVTFLSDQDVGPGGVFVEFLGKAASTPRGPALYAWKYDAPAVVSIMLPAASGCWEVVFEEVPRPATGEREEFIREMTEYFTGRLEEYVRRAPEYWFWPHRRWKTPPPD